MSEARIDSLSNESNTGGPTISGITTFSGTNYFVPPVGSSGERPHNPQKGSLRFNTDSKKLEYYRGEGIGWVELEASHGQVGGGTGSNTGTGARGFTAGHHVYGTTIEYITISSTGDSQDFGDLSEGRFSQGNLVGTDSRMLFAGGYGYKNTIDFWTVQSLGNASDFGDLTIKRQKMSGCNDKIRGVWAGGTGPSHALQNTIDYVTIQTTGNAVDFGDISVNKDTLACVSSSTRGIWTFHIAPTAIMEFTNIRSTGNTTDFGDGYLNNSMYGGGSSSTRGIFCGGYADNNTIQFITMATTGNTTDFGDLTQGGYNFSNMSSPTRCVFGARKYYSGGFVNSNILDYVQITTTGNAVDFGDMTYMGSQQLACAGSNAHGGSSG